MVSLLLLQGLAKKTLASLTVELFGDFSPWPLSLVDRADSLLLNVGE